MALPDDFDLTGFTGTERYYRFSGLFPKFVLTDGTEYLADAAGAYWLMDAVASHLPKYRDQEFVVATLKKRKKTWLLTLDDGNDNVLAKQVIEYSDFPLDEIKLYVTPQDDLWVILLCSEY